MIQAGQEYPIKLLVTLARSGAGLVADTDGVAADHELGLVGSSIEDWDVSAPDGLGAWIWQGTIAYSSIDHDGDGCEPSFDGEWRRATSEEATRFAAGERLWA